MGQWVGSMPRHDYALCLGLSWFVLPGCTVPEIQFVHTRDDDSTEVDASFVPPDGPRGSADGGMDEMSAAGRGGRGAGSANGSSGAAGAKPSGNGGTTGRAGSPGAAGAAEGGSGGVSGSSGIAGAGEAGMGGIGGMMADAGPPPAPGPDEPNPCLVWLPATSRDRAPANAVEGGLEITAGLESRQYVCRVKPPDLDYAVPGKVIFGNGCLVAYRSNGATKAHNQQNGTPFEVLTAGPGCNFTWQSADNSSVPNGALDLSEPPLKKLYACRGNFQGPLSSGTQVGGVQGASDTPPRYECWFESYTSPMQPMNPMQFDVLVQAP
jgi:hypothetical protein